MLFKLLKTLTDNKKEKVLTKIPIEDKNLFEETLSTYPENSAARIMQREFAAVPQDWSLDRQSII